MRDVNILILDYKEELIRWLDPDLAEVEETTEKNACRKIKITYPYENEYIDENTELWYQQGNKIFIPSINGITSCLYVINTQYEIDFWDKNTVTVEAEEVLTELNYDMVSFKSNTVITLTDEKLDEWFGMFYDIQGMDKLASNKKQVSPEGIMSRMSLLRMIEEETGRIFITSYENVSNTIQRQLFLADPTQLRFVADTETLDLNYNLESLEFIKSEEDTYNAMAPVFTNHTNVTTAEEITSNPSASVNTLVVNKAEQRTEQNPLTLNQTISDLYNKLSDSEVIAGGDTPVISTNAVDGDELLEKWLEYEVAEGQEIPMIITQDDDGNTVSKATWNAPFAKEAGELYIKYVGVNQTDYNSINPYNPAKSPTMMKCGKENTSETLCEAIYNELATSLLNKMSPDYELKIQVKDIQDLLGDYSLGYQVHESLQVRVPNFNYYVPCRITETVKNLHYPGENTIKIETEVLSIFDMLPTKIESGDRIIGTNEAQTVLGGILTEEDGTPLEEKYVVMDIKLTSASTSGSSTVQEQELKKFDPVNNTYFINDIQIQNLEKQIRNNRIKNNTARGTYKIRDVEGVAYSIGDEYARSLVFTRNNIYIINEEWYGGRGTNALGHGFFDDTIEVHIYPRGEGKQKIYASKTFNEMKRYYYSVTYDNYMTNEPWPWQDADGVYRYHHGGAISCERQNGATCLPASMSNATAAVFAYRTEYELSKMMGTSTTRGTSVLEAMRVMENLGFKVDYYPATQANIEKYFKTPQSFASFSVDAFKLGQGYYKDHYHVSNDEEGNHAILGLHWLNYDGTLYIHVIDSNIPVYHPAYGGDYTERDTWVKWSDLEQGLNAAYDGKQWYYRRSGETAWFSVLTITDKLLGDVDESLTANLVTNMFNPELYEYKFDLSVVRKGIMELLDFIRSSDIDIDIMSSSTSIETSSNVALDNVSMWWLRAMSFAAMYYYQGTQEKTSNRKVIDVSSNSDSMKYYKHFNQTVDAIGEYDWFTPCKVTDTAYTLGYICSTLLFNLGIPYSYYDFPSGDNYINLNTIGNTVVDKAGNINNNKALHYWIVTIDEVEDIVAISQRSRDSFQDTVFLTWGYSTELNNSATVKNSKYPVMLINTWEENTSKITYQNILGTGNSPSSKYDTTSAGAGNSNPYGVTLPSTIKTWNDNIKDQLTDGDKGKALVISWFKEDDFKNE